MLLLRLPPLCTCVRARGGGAGGQCIANRDCRHADKAAYCIGPILGDSDSYCRCSPGPHHLPPSPSFPVALCNLIRVLAHCDGAKL